MKPKDTLTDGQSDGEAAFDFYLRTKGAQVGLPKHVREYPIPEGNRRENPATTQPFRADFAWPEFWVLFEVQGKGHERGDKYRNDWVRHNLLTMWGYRVLYATPDQINDDPARLIGILRRLLTKGEASHE